MIDGPYKLFSADKYACPSCKKEVVADFPVMPIVEHYQPNYAATVATFHEKVAPVVRYWANPQEKAQYDTHNGGDQC